MQHSMEGYFERILQLVQKTGDRVIVTDPSLKKAFVIMDLDQYEAIVNLNAVSRKEQEEGFTEEDFDLIDAAEEVLPAPKKDKEDALLVEESKKPGLDPTIWQVMSKGPAKEINNTWDMAKLSEEERIELERAFYAHKNYKQEKSPNLPHSDDLNGGKPSPEESFYLGSVE